MPRYDWSSSGSFPPGFDPTAEVRVVNLDTGNELTVIWCDTDTGEYESFVLNEHGGIRFDPATGHAISKRDNARLGVYTGSYADTMDVADVPAVVERRGDWYSM